MANSLLKDAAGNVVAISVPSSGGDDTSNIQAAITLATGTYGDAVEIWLASASYQTTGITLNNYTKLKGFGASIQLASGHNGPIISGAYTGIIKNPLYGYAKGLVLVGNNVNGGTNGPTTTDIGFHIDDHPTFCLEDVTVQNCWTGFHFYGTQFTRHHRLRALGCGVSYFLSPQPTNGGGNSNSFYDCVSVDSYVHLIYAGLSGIGGIGSNVWINPSWEGSYCAGVAGFANGGGAAQMVFKSGSIENTARDTTTLTSYTYTAPNSLGTFVVPQCGVYLNQASMALDDFSNEDAFIATNVWANLTSGSHLVLVRPQGYGIPYGYHVQCDDTSDVEVIGGGGSILGTIEGVSSLSGAIAQVNSTLECMFVVPPHVNVDTTLPNGFQQPSTAQADGINAPFSSVVFSTDAVFGPCAGVSMSPTASGTLIHIPVTFPASGTNRVVLAYNIMATEDVQMDSTIASNQDPNLFHLVANVWRRVVQIWDTSLNGAQTIEIKLQSNAASGFACYLQKFHILSGPANSAQTNSQVNRIAQGAYNSKFVSTNAMIAAAQAANTANMVDNVNHNVTAAMINAIFADLLQAATNLETGL